MSDFWDEGGADLIASLANNATSAYQTSVIANANPENAALITGGAYNSPYGSAYGNAPLTSGLGGSTGLLLLIVAAAVVIFAVKS